MNYVNYNKWNIIYNPLIFIVYIRLTFKLRLNGDKKKLFKINMINWQHISKSKSMNILL